MLMLSVELARCTDHSILLLGGHKTARVLDQRTVSRQQKTFTSLLSENFYVTRGWCRLVRLYRRSAGRNVIPVAFGEF
jgi:hypothetical protein